MSKTLTLRDKIINSAINNPLGLTAMDVQKKFKVSRSTASAALTELKNEGSLYTNGVKYSNKTGRFNTVYTIHNA